MFGVTAECGGGRRRARKAEQGPGRLSSRDATLGADQQRGGRARSHEGWHGEEGARGGGCGPRFWQRPWSGRKAVSVDVLRWLCVYHQDDRHRGSGLPHRLPSFVSPRGDRRTISRGSVRTG